MVTKSSEYLVTIIDGELLPGDQLWYGPFPLLFMAENIARAIIKNHATLNSPCTVKITGQVYRERFAVKINDELVFSKKSNAEEAAGQIADLIGKILHYDQNDIRKFLELCIDIKREEYPMDIEPITYDFNYSKTLSSKESEN